MSTIGNSLEDFPSFEKASSIKPAFLGLIVRCKDERVVVEFCQHYFSEGVDRIIIVDDGSADLSVYSLIKDDRVTVIYERDIINRNYVDSLYNIIREKFTWLIYVDVDEFITGRGAESVTIKESLETVFVSADCVKVPWVMMSCNRRQEPPESLRSDLVYRWNHDLRHPHQLKKFRCRYDQIEVKCIFRPKVFQGIFDHHPLKPIYEDVVIVDSIDGSLAKLDPFYENLREHDINRSILACYHYRIMSVRDAKNKIKNNIWYKNYTIDELMASDYPEVYDNVLQKKALRLSEL